MSNPAGDWYERTTWTDDDERDFFSRIARERKWRSEKIRVQAHCLLHASPSRCDVALRLCDLWLKENPNDMQEAQIRVMRGESLLRLGETAAALQDFRTAIHAERRAPTYQILAPVEFAYAVSRVNQRDLLGEALDELEAMKRPVVMAPHSTFRLSAANAVFANWLGKEHEAKRSARSALALVDGSPLLGAAVLPWDLKHTVPVLRRLAGEA